MTTETFSLTIFGKQYNWQPEQEFAVLYCINIQGVPLPFDPPGQPKLQGVFVYYYKYIASKVTNLKFYAIRSIINISSLSFLNCGQLF